MFSQTNSVLRSSGKSLEDISCCLQEQYFAQTAAKPKTTGAHVGFFQVTIMLSNERKGVKKTSPGMQPAMLGSHPGWITWLLDNPGMIPSG